MTLVLENRLDLLVVMPIGHNKSVMFMIPPMLISRTIIVVVPLTILVNGHEVDASQASLRYATYGMDTITLDDPSSILFLSMAHVTILRFVKLAHTLNHLQDLHYVVVDETHLFLSNFIPIMKRLLPLWVVGCQLVTLIASLSPSQNINLKITMSTTFIVIRTLTMCLLIGYVVDEVVDVDNEFIQQFIKWDCNVSCEIDRGIIYFLTQQSIEQMALIANNVACIKSIHLHAHLDENTKKMQS